MHSSCEHHTHDLLAEAEALCLRKGLRLTPTRRRVLELIHSMPGGVKAYELLDRLSLENTSARPPTIYRAIEFLLENGLIHRIESLNAYVSCSCPQHPQAFQLLICQTCGGVQELHETQVDQQLDAAAKRHDFQIHKKNIELLGCCARCQQTSSEQR